MKKNTGKQPIRVTFLAIGWLLAVLVLGGQSLPVLAAEKENTGWKSGAGIATLLDNPDGDEDAEAADSEADKTDAETADSEADKTDAKAADNAADKAGNSAEAGPENETGKLVMAQVNNVLNVRREPDSNAELAGYLYADCGGTIVERKGGWTKLESGELVGWAKDDYLLFNEAAEEAAKDSGRMVARTTTGALRIRKEPSKEAGIYDLLEEGAEYEVVNAEQLAFSDGIEISDEWVAVDYEGKTGFVSSEYVEVEFIIDHGESVEQVEKRQEEERLRKEQEAKAAAEKKRKQEIEKAKAMATDDAVLLAALIQCEAGDEPYEGQVAVGAVVMNRVLSRAYPSTIKDVIFASGQFTPAGSGKLGRVIASGKIKPSCLQAATDAMAGVNPIGTATHFRRAGSRDGLVIGHHVFW